MKARRSVFLDIDGVILRHRGIQTRVAQRCSLYVAKKLGVGLEVGQGVNRLMYETYGHTLYGFEEGVGSLEREFTEFVYSLRLMEELAGLKKDPGVQEDREELWKLLDRCEKNGVDVWIMSNAPKVWCDGVLDLMDWKLKEDRVLHCGHTWYKNELKPSVRVFMSVQEAHGSEGELVLVDDSVRNIEGAVAAGWKGRLFGLDDCLGNLEI